jgi:hypothetical protein
MGADTGMPTPSGPEPLPGDDGIWRTLAIVALKALHTFIYFFESLCVFAVLYGAIRNRIHKWTVAAIVVIVLEGVVLFFNQMQCPLRIWTERLGAARGSVTDLFLPRWLADRIFQIYTPLFLIGCLGVVWRKLRS